MRKLKLIAAALFLISPLAANADLIGTWEGTWDQAGTVTGTLEMSVTGQVADGADFLLDGYFDWMCVTGAVCSGQELFEGTLVGDLFAVSGFALVNDVGLALGSYTGTVSANGNSISGTFTFLGGTQAVGNWSVTKVPEPGTLGLLGIGLLGIGIARRKKV